MSRRKGKGSPTTPGQRGRYDGFDVLAQVPHWDPITTGVVLNRLAPDRRLSFFNAEEEPTLRALLDLLLAQYDDPKVPVAELIDQRLAAGETDGWRYEDMPEDGDAWKKSLAALDRVALNRHSRRFGQLEVAEQADLVQDVQDAKEWEGFAAGHLWSLWTRYACAAFYSHPWAWNEIGFSGPAYPRGYKNMGIGKREGWEVPEEDATDPVPWAERVEAANRAHRDRHQTAP